MGYQTILTYLPNARLAIEALAATKAVAQIDNAHVIGLYVAPALRNLGATPLGASDVTGELIEQHQEWHREESEKTRDLFDKAMGGEAFVFEWRHVDSGRPDPLDDALDHARNAELIISPLVGEEDSDFEDERIGERLMMESGRPVLLIPTGSLIQHVGRHVTLAWDASQQSSRAAFDALPLLKTAEHVQIVWVDPVMPAGQSRSRAADEIAASLARCGVTCEAVDTQSEGRGIGAELLARARDHGSDLLVMGGYGQSRFREFIFGGATRDVLRTMTIPVLMSH